MRIVYQLPFLPDSQWKCDGVGVQFSERIKKCADRLSFVIFVCAQDTGKGFAAVKRNPGKLAAVIVEEAWGKTDSASGGNIGEGGIVVRAVEVVELSGAGQPVLDGLQRRR